MDTTELRVKTDLQAFVDELQRFTDRYREPGLRCAKITVRGVDSTTRDIRRVGGIPVEYGDEFSVFVHLEYHSGDTDQVGRINVARVGGEYPLRVEFSQVREAGVCFLSAFAAHSKTLWAGREPGQDAESGTGNVDLSKLLDVLSTRFDSSELREFCFHLKHLGVDYDNLRGEGKKEKALELISYCERRECIPELVETIVTRRSDISWADVTR